jgi:hypothetical protein
VQANVQGTVLDVSGTLLTTQNLTAATGFYLRAGGISIGGIVNLTTPGYAYGGR